MAAGAELIHLIDLSLGAEPCGVVNFNYLHGLLHEIVKRLVQVEGQTSISGPDAHGDVHVHIAGQGTTQAPGDTQKQDKVIEEEPTELTEATDVGGTPLESPARQPSGSLSREASATSGRQPSGTPLRSMGSSFMKSRGSIVTAANDVGALERKLQDLELRVNTMESLPDMLEKKSSDSGATPVSDMWNFTMLSKRLSATEEGLDKVLITLHVIKFDVVWPGKQR